MPVNVHGSMSMNTLFHQHVVRDWEAGTEEVRAHQQ